MATELLNLRTGEIISFTNVSWEEILNLALNEGWKPQGTVLYKDNNCFEINEDWDSGDYISNSGQVIESKDADALGEFLSLAISKSEIMDKININYDSEILSCERIKKFIDKFCVQNFTKLRIR